MNILQGLLELPIRRAIQVLRSKTSNLNRKLGYSPAYFDQYPGKATPWCFSKLYGPIDEVDGALTTNDQSAFFLPKGSNILTGRDATFLWKETNIYAFAQRSATVNSLQDIFDPERAGGGAAVLQNFQGPQAVNNRGDLFSKISLELDLYDKKRGRSITSGRMPILGLQAGSFETKGWEDWPRLDPDSEIEPRLYVLDASEPSALATADVRFFVNIVFKGVMISQEVSGRESLQAETEEHADDDQRRDQEIGNRGKR